MAAITLEGNRIHTIGDLPATGSQAPDFLLTGTDLKDVSLADFAGRKKVLNIVVSLDTGICETSLNTFEQKVRETDNAVALTITSDLPFAGERICKAGGENAVSLSQFRTKQFGKDYGVEIVDGPLAGLLARAVVILDESDKVIYTELVPEIAQHPDYDKALAALI